MPIYREIHAQNHSRLELCYYFNVIADATLRAPGWHKPCEAADCQSKNAHQS